MGQNWYPCIDDNVDNKIEVIIDVIDNNVDTSNIDIDTIDSNIININDTNNIDIYIKSINLSNFKNFKFSIFDENFVRSKVDRNNMLMSSYFACTHVFDPNFLMGSSEITENSNLDRFHPFFDW